jgi:hypothetical protein
LAQAIVNQAIGSRALPLALFSRQKNKHLPFELLLLQEQILPLLTMARISAFGVLLAVAFLSNSVLGELAREEDAPQAALAEDDSCTNEDCALSALQSKVSPHAEAGQASAQAYLDSQNIDQRLAEAKMVLLRERPEDAGKFLAEKLLSGAGMRKKVEDPLSCGQLLDTIEVTQTAWLTMAAQLGADFQKNGTLAERCEGAVNNAMTLLDELYAFGADRTGTILFKPTVATDPTFRKTFDEALSYFVGPCLQYVGKVPIPSDGGFALGYTAQPDATLSELKGFKAGSFSLNNEQVLQEDESYCTVAWQGGLTLVPAANSPDATVDKSFVFRIDKKEKRARIVLHHSSLTL